MPELTTADVVSYTNGRLTDTPQTQRLLDSAVSLARRYCGWHVTPEVSEDIVIDGPGGDLLVIPTLRMSELFSVIEDEVSLDMTTLAWSRRGLVRKTGCAWWTHTYSGIVVSLAHGFVSAPEWQSAVLSYVDRTALAGVSGGPREAVGPFVFGATAMGSESAFSTAEKALLDLYRLEPAQ